MRTFISLRIIMSGKYKIVFIVVLLWPVHLKGQEIADNFAATSVLSSGTWFRMSVTADGIYRVDFNTLKLLGLENPSHPKIYANNRGQLPYIIGEPCPDDLEEIAVSINKGSDGIFNEGDYLLFYGQGTGRWLYNKITGNYVFLRHNYSDTAYYFITSSSEDGRSVIDARMPVSDPGYTSNSSDAMWIHEEEVHNILKSGREWYQPVSHLRGVVVAPTPGSVITSEPVKYNIRLLARSPGPVIFRLYEGGNSIDDINIDGVDISSPTGIYARIALLSGSAMPSSSSPGYEIRFLQNSNASARGWIDYALFQGRKTNSFRGETTFIRDSRSVAPGQISEFTVSSSSDRVSVWDVTDPTNPAVVSYSGNGNDIRFLAFTDSLRTFVVFTPERSLRPGIGKSPVHNQDLHRSPPAEMIIVTHPDFIDYARRLSDIHYQNSGLLSMVVTPREIYNEFSGGIPDIVSIRNFIRMKYLKQKGTGMPLRYLLLFGDGSYDNRIPPPLNPCYIPTYQSENSNIVISSFTSDDFYGLLDDGEGEDYGSLDIGIGRLPVSDTAEAGIMIKKIASYLSPSTHGDWKNVVVFVADDEDGNTHMTDAERLAGLINDKVPELNVGKIYFDAYRQVTTANGRSYPDVTRAINDRMNTGSLLLNYTGHGNETGLGHERVVTIESIRQWHNNKHLPLFITATCEFSRFDDVEISNLTNEREERDSAGELILLHKEGGAIALMSTTRLVYSSPNYFLNYNILDASFDINGEEGPPALGDIIRIAKNRSSGGVNMRNFILLGDPALKLSYPARGNVVTDSVFGINTGEITDTLKALSLVTVSGHIEDEHGRPAEDFNGVLSHIVFDEPEKVTTLANDGGTPMDFDRTENMIFRGKTSVSDGKFSFTFRVPRDINHRPGRGKISYYAYDEKRDFNGYYDNIFIGGFSESVDTDATGPEIKLYLNDTLFRNGGLTDDSPRLFAMISDSGGINTAGSGIGHDIKIWLDNDMSSPVILNNYFINDFGSYCNGTIDYRLYGLAPGRHTLTLQAWDNYNNSSEKSISFEVGKSDIFMIRNLMNYPNPFGDRTTFTAEHNRPGMSADVTINIFNLAGEVIKIIRTSVDTEGYRLPPVEWDGKDNRGKKPAGGLYPYSLHIRTRDGETSSISSRLIIY